MSKWVSRMSHWVTLPERTEVLKMKSGKLMFTIVKDYIHCPSGVTSWNDLYSLEPKVWWMAVQSLCLQQSQFSFIRQPLMGRLYCHGKRCKFILFNSFHKALLSLKIKAHLSLENINREKFWALFHHTEMTFQQKPGISSENHLVLLSFVTENWNVR